MAATLQSLLLFLPLIIMLQSSEEKDNSPPQPPTLQSTVSYINKYHGLDELYHTLPSSTPSHKEAICALCYFDVIEKKKINQICLQTKKVLKLSIEN